MRDVLPEIERRMLADFPGGLREWRTSVELAEAEDAAQSLGVMPLLPYCETVTPASGGHVV